MQIKHFKLYLLVLGLLTFIVIAAMGGGVWGQQLPYALQWQHRAFASLCHQMPTRSFWINGQPMAVCSRCFGIYSGLLTTWILLPIFSIIKMETFISPVRLLSGTFLLNVLDVIGNYLGFWHNTLISRVALGGLMGLAAAALFSGVFFIKTKTTKKQEYYGRIITTNRARP